MHYVVKDMVAMLPYALYGVIGGLACAILLNYNNQRRLEKNRAQARVLPCSILWGYLVMLLTITFLSRESGTSGVVDLELFSTLKINTRNSAYAIENVLLFIPYGVLVPWVLKRMRHLWKCAALGALNSLAIESMQLFTGRGCFQVDDILANLIGSVLGYLLWGVCNRIYRKIKA